MQKDGFDPYCDYFDLDLQAVQDWRTRHRIEGEKENAKFAYRLKESSFEMLAGGFYGNPNNPLQSQNSRATNVCFLPVTAAGQLAAMKEWDDQQLDNPTDPAKTFEVRYIWNFATQAALQSRLHLWVGRLDIFYVRPTGEKRNIALWINSLEQIAFLRGLAAYPDLLIMAVPPTFNIKKPIKQATLFRDFELPTSQEPVVWVQLRNGLAQLGLAEHIEDVGRHLELMERQQRVRRNDKGGDPLAEFRSKSRGNNKKLRKD